MRYLELLDLRRKGEITDLQRQVSYELIPPQKVGKTTVRAAAYVADFVYRLPSGETVVEDVKGIRTDLYRLKKKLMLYRHGIWIKEV